MNKKTTAKKFIPAAVLATGIIFTANGVGHAASGGQVLSYGNQFLGTPYVFGAPYGQTNSFDCSSFTETVFAHFGIQLPRTSSAQANVGVPVSKSNLQAGDLLFYDTDGDGVINHVGIYDGNGQMLNADSTHGVKYSPAFSPTYWNKYFVTARRVLDGSSSNPPSSNPTPSPAHDNDSSGGNSSVYTVKSGDSLWKIASSHGMSTAQLKSMNGLTSDMIYVGQKLKLKGNASSANESNKYTPSGSHSTSSGGTYVVKSGDSLWKIASDHGMSVAQLKSINGLTSDMIHPGQKLKLKGNASSASESNKYIPSGSHSTSSGGTYVVKSGDSLWKIASSHGMSVAQLKSINGLTSDMIHPGQKLKLSGSASASGDTNHKTSSSSKKPAASFYKVKSGDSLWEIALLNDTTVNKLMKANHLSSIVIYPGQKLAIPK
ncbi:LysM peptidoglycan-binding domain-containing protein [Scopulibacillus cellulosilyticus]|uniref:LysM peptidoglycan-binding domain-containing protein n=1 Tax=Scopulibacillus cellulosilyticus TaxID=2665665 RepID=A0ABW2Q1V8_9BACL